MKTNMRKFRKSKREKLEIQRIKDRSSKEAHDLIFGDTVISPDKKGYYTIPVRQAAKALDTLNMIFTDINE